jgi:D-3-phosphoglycerate dehydrogenase / 2-oxoglutarate reductase
MLKILNTLDISGIPEVSKIFNKHQLINVKADRDIAIREIVDCDAYLASAAIQIDEDFLKQANKLKIIGSPSTGTDHMDLNLIKQKGIKCYDISKELDLINSFTATSELAFTLLLSLVRKIIPASQDANNGIWAREKYSGTQLLNKTIGIVGLGRLGKISAKIANGFGMNVIAYDTNKKNVHGIKMVSLEDLARESDFISIHVHLNTSTENLINLDIFNKMKKSAIIINTSRGKIINEKDLILALNTNLISGACLDVIDGEWLTQKELYNHPLVRYSRTHKNLLLSPHIGGATQESIYGARLFMAKKIASFLGIN